MHIAARIKRTRPMSFKHFVNEKFVTSEKDPASLLWVNGTTDKRFDINGNWFKDVSNENELGKLSPWNPCYFTSDIGYAFRYIQGHISTDYGKERLSLLDRRKIGTNVKSDVHKKAEDRNGVVVFAKLKSGVRLFDFSDTEDFKAVFGAQDGEQISLLFKGFEPYFAFSTVVPNALIPKVPIEFSIAQKVALFCAHRGSLYKKAKPGDDGALKANTSFFQNRSFIEFFKTAKDIDAFNVKVTPELYNEFISFYNATMQGAEVGVSAVTGRKQIKKGSTYLKDLPQELTKEQLDKVNAYFTLLQWCIAARDDLMKDASAEIQQITDNTSSKSRKSYMDLLQACLFSMISSQHVFSGFWCPEYKGSGQESQAKPSIAIFDRDAIEKVRSYNAGLVAEIVDEMVHYSSDWRAGECNIVLQELKSGLDRFEQKAAEEKKRQEEERAKEKAREADRQSKLQNGWNDINIAFSNRLEDAVEDLRGRMDLFNLKQLHNACDRWYREHKGEFMKITPQEVVAKFVRAK